MTDGLAILQVTLLLATCSIFVLGGSIKKVAECCEVLKAEPSAIAPTPLSRRTSRSRLLATPG